MIIGIPVDDTKKEVCEVFARAPYFLLYHSDKNEMEIIENEGAVVESGAGLKGSQVLLDHEVDILLTIRCGENVAKVLDTAGIKIYKANKGNVIENIRAFKDSKLELLTHFHSGFQGIQ